MKSRLKLFTEHGFSLVEMMVVVGILSVVAVGTSMQLIGTYRDSLRAQSKSNMVQTKGLINKAFGRTAVGARACRDVLQPVTRFNTTPGQETPVRIRLSDTEVLAPDVAEGKVQGQAEFQIRRMYLADTYSLAPQRPRSYLTNLYMAAEIGPRDLLTSLKPRAVATIVVTLDMAGGIESCNVSTTTPTANETCNAMYGMTWNAQTGQCDQALALDTNFNLTACPPGTHLVASVCVPTTSGCGTGQIAKGFDKGLTSGCATPPLNPAIGILSVPVSHAVENVANQTPRPATNPGPTVAPVTTAPIAATAPAATPTPAPSCVTGIGSPNYNFCINSPVCAGQISGVPAATNAQCVATSGTPYSTPAPASTPSLAPPPDLSCACNNARIPNGSYCAYCIPSVDYGYGYVDYAFGVNVCNSGNLVPDSSATANFDPTLECSGGYAPTRPIGASFRQFEGYRNAYQ